ncbi:MAG TPA: hypothetical protein VGM09_23150 [Bradyrhizobium sp.]
MADFAAENTGGVLTGFLAEEEHLDRRGMLRLGAWGSATVGAIILAVLANQSSLRLRRDELAAADLTRQAQQIQSVARESQTETRRLASAIDTLNSDRDRMYTRLSTLEQGLDSVTGAIARQNAAAATSPVVPAPAASTTPAAPSAASASTAPALPTPHAVADSAAPTLKATTESAPLIGPVATTAIVTGKQATEAKRPEPANAKLAAATSASAAPAAAAPTPSNSPAATASVPLVAAKSMMGPPDSAASKLIEPEPAKGEAMSDAKTAAVTAPPATASPPTPMQAVPAAQAAPAAPAPETIAAAPVTDKSATDKPATEKAAADAAPQASPQLAVNRTEFGVDVGGANSVGGLRALWRGLLKSRSNAPLAALQPIMVIKEGSNGLGMQLRLVAGPLTDAAAAAKICATMVENERPCATTVYDGQRLAMKADDAMGATGSISRRNSSEKSSEAPADEKSAAEKPVAPKSGKQAWRRRSYAKRAAAVIEEPAKKPESTTTSTLSSFFSRR